MELLLPLLIVNEFVFFLLSFSSEWRVDTFGILACFDTASVWAREASEKVRASHANPKN